MNFKTLFKPFLFAGALAIAVSANAVLPTYKTIGTNGLNATLPACVIFPSDPNSQIRVVEAYYQSDSATGVLQFTSGAGAYTQISTNTGTSAVTNLLNSTNGLIPGAVLVLEHGGIEYTNILSSWNAGTNGVGVLGGPTYVLNSGWGVIPSPGDNIYQMGPTNFIAVGAATNALNGEAIYVGNYGRPVMIRLTPAASTNSLPAETAHYDSQSQ